MKTIGAEMKHWYRPSLLTATVSLFNHSDVSAFKRVQPSMVPSIIRANYHPKMNPPKKVIRPIIDHVENPEDMLTIEETHFTPLLPDGHYFYVDNRWEEI